MWCNIGRIMVDGAAAQGSHEAQSGTAPQVAIVDGAPIADFSGPLQENPLQHASSAFFF